MEKTQYNVLSYKLHFHFHLYKLAREIDENGHSDRIFDYEIKRQKAIEQELGCEMLELILTKMILIFLKLSNNHQIN